MKQLTSSSRSHAASDLLFKIGNTYEDSLQVKPVCNYEIAITVFGVVTVWWQQHCSEVLMAVTVGILVIVIIGVVIT